MVQGFILNTCDASRRLLKYKKSRTRTPPLQSLLFLVLDVIRLFATTSLIYLGSVIVVGALLALTTPLVPGSSLETMLLSVDAAVCKQRTEASRRTELLSLNDSANSNWALLNVCGSLLFRPFSVPCLCLYVQTLVVPAQICFAHHKANVKRFFARIPSAF